jgi:hypothetical protein
MDKNAERRKNKNKSAFFFAPSDSVSGLTREE